MHPEVLRNPPRVAAHLGGRPVRRSLSDRLREAILALADGQGQVREHTETAWASITFAGTRHQLDLMFEGPHAVEAGEQLIAALPDHEFAIPRQLVADATITAVESTLLPTATMTLSCEILLLEDA